MKRIVDIELPRPRTSEIVSSEAFGRYVAQIWSDLREEASRGMIDDETRALHVTAEHETHDAPLLRARRMAPHPWSGSERYRPAILAVVEILIRVGAINRFIVPLPSEVAASFGRVIIEEDILHRFLLTGWECLAAGVLLTVFGVAIGVLLHRCTLLRRACETWVARHGVGAAGAGLSAVPGAVRAQRADHHHAGLHRRPARRSSSRPSRACRRRGAC